MTILEDPAENMEVLLERRRAATGPRRSWASTEPFVTHPREALPAYDATHWGSVAGHYVRQALAVDACIVALVIGVAAMFDAAAAWWSAVAGLVFLITVAAGHGYDRKSLGDGPVEFQAVLRAGVGPPRSAALGSVAFAVPPPRVHVAGTVVLLTVGAAIGRYLLRRSLHGRRSRGVAMSRTLVVGDATSVAHVIRDLGARDRTTGTRSRRLPAEPDHAPAATDVPVLGALADIAQVVATTRSTSSSSRAARCQRRGAAAAVVGAGPRRRRARGRPRASSRSPGRACTCVRRRGCRCSRSRRRAPRRACSPRRPWTAPSARSSCSWSSPVILAAAVAVAPDQPRSGAFYHAARVGVDGRDVHDVEAAQHVRGRRRASRRAAGRQRPRRADVQDARRPPRHAGRPRAAPVLARRAPAAAGTSSRATCRSSARARRCRRRSTTYHDAVHRRLRVQARA